MAEYHIATQKRGYPVRRNTLFAFIALAMAAPSLLDAQTVTGTVRDQATGNPVNAAQVFVEGLDIGTLSQANGQYLIINVPAGRTPSPCSPSATDRSQSR